MKILKVLLFHLLSYLLTLSYAVAACISSGDQTTLNNALSSGGPSTIVQLCPNTLILINDLINFTADDQEISTEGYPTDGSRATIRAAPGSNVGTLVAGAFHSGIRLLNMQIDGDRPTNGWLKSAGANIELGGGGSGVIISHVASRNPRGWSCMHLSESGQADNPCTNVTVTNNDIGPCGQEGTDAAGNGQWSDGISFACRDSLVSRNTVTGSTDGGIVLFNAPGTAVADNTIVSSATESGFGAINLVDYLGVYGGSYADVTVSRNTIRGDKLFNVGIAIGGCAWSFGTCNPVLSGPAAIEDNVLSGHISFPIGVNGWTGGLTVAGNDVSAVTTPASSFSESINCSPELQTLFNQNAHLIYYPPGVTGPLILQSDFVAAEQNAVNFICTSSLLPSSVSFLLDHAFSGNVAELHGNILISYQGDNNLVVYNTAGANGYEVEFASGHTVDNCAGLCSLIFQGDGNLVSYYNGRPLWNSRTVGVGQTLVALNVAPWLQILDAGGEVIWDSGSIYDR